MFRQGVGRYQQQLEPTTQQYKLIRGGGGQLHNNKKLSERATKQQYTIISGGVGNYTTIQT